MKKMLELVYNAKIIFNWFKIELYLMLYCWQSKIFSVNELERNQLT